MATLHKTEEISFREYAELINKHSTIYKVKYPELARKEKYQTRYLIDTPVTWKRLPNFQKEDIIKALKYKIKKELP